MRCGVAPLPDPSPAAVSPVCVVINVISTVLLHVVAGASTGITIASATLSPWPAPAVQSGALVAVPGLFS